MKKYLVPAFFFGYADADKPKILKAAKMLKGAQPYSKFKETLKSLLSPQ